MKERFLGNSRLELTQMSFCGGHEQENKPLEKKISCHCIKTTVEKDEDWIIPITLSNNQIDCPAEKFLMTKKQEIFQFNTPVSSSIEHSSDESEPSNKKRRHSSQWFKLNICSGGPYRVFYSSDMLDNLIEAMNKHELNTFDRFNIENDMYALAMGGFTSLVDYLRLLLKAYMNENDDELVWKDIENNLIRIATLLEYDKQLYEFYQKFILYFHRNLYRILGFTSKMTDEQDESIARGRLRCFLLVILGTIGYDLTIIDNAREQLHVYLYDSRVTVLWPICAIVAHHASDTDLNNLFKLWEQRTHRDDRLRCAYGLSYVQHSSHIQRVLDFFAMNNSNHPHVIRLNERIECYKGFCLSKQGRYHYQGYIENHWLTLRTHYDDEYLEALIRETFGYFSTKDEAIRIEKFFLSNEIVDQKCPIPAKETTPATPCTRIAVHLSLDDNELSSINRSALPSPILSSRLIIPEKVKAIASNIAHTTRTRAALLERDRDHLLAFFQSESILLPATPHANSSSQILSLNPITNASNVISSCSTTSTTPGNKRKRRISLNTNSSSPPVRNLLASDTSV